MARTFSRRDVLKASSALALTRSGRVRPGAAAPPAERDHARADRGRARRKARSSGTPRSTCRWPRRSPRRSRRNIPASRCASSAPAPSACSSASARSTPAASTRSTSSTRRTPRISSSGSATACLQPYVPEDVAKYYPAEHKDPDGLFASFRVGLSVDRLQHQSGEGRGRAEELRRSARSEMVGQDRQGASGLQRHDHDARPTRSRAISAGSISRSSPSRRSCRCSPRPIRRRSSRSASAP